jgi:hypothetical protein
MGFDSVPSAGRNFYRAAAKVAMSVAMYPCEGLRLSLARLPLGASRPKGLGSPRIDLGRRPADVESVL